MKAKPGSAEAVDAIAPADPLPDTSRRRTGQARRGNTRAALVRCGTQMCTERGFHATGIEEVLRRVGIPKGSFYHYFASKQAFGEAVIDDYARYFAGKLDRTLGDTARKPLDRLAAFAEDAQDGMARHHFKRGCLVGNLGQELGGLNDAFRDRLESVLLSWQRRTAACLQAAQTAGEIRKNLDVHELAEFFWIGWEGAILRAKLSQDTAPMELFMRLFLASVRG